VNKPPADVPEAAGWHHAHGVDPVEKGELARRRKEFLCRQKRITKPWCAAFSKKSPTKGTWT
jgi:hypothetical protein